MPVNPVYNSRSGGNKFLLLAQTLCRLVGISGPVIRLRFADRPALIAVLDAAESLCALLPAAQAEQATMDAQAPSSFDPGDAVVIPGQVE